MNLTEVIRRLRSGDESALARMITPEARQEDGTMAGADAATDRGKQVDSQNHV
jgi:putative protein kinase ArgK-like GTPase of G3E family